MKAGNIAINIAAVAAVAAYIPIGYAQQFDSTELTISSTAAGTTVGPGQAIPFLVAASPGVTLTNVSVIGPVPFGILSPSSQSPLYFSVVVPPGTRSGEYDFAAWAVDGGGNQVVSVPITLDLESATNPLSLTPSPKYLNFDGPGQALPVSINAIYADSSVTDVTSSTNVVFSSANLSIATVDSNGLVTAVGPGRTTITARYGPPSSSLLANVSISVLPSALVAIPTAILFGASRIGSTVSQSISIINNSKNPISIISVKAAGDFVASDDCVSQSPIAGGSACVATVSFTPSSGGTETGVLNLLSRMTSVPIGVSLTGVGLYNFNWVIGKPPPALNAVGGDDGYGVIFSLGGDFGLTAVVSVSTDVIPCPAVRAIAIPGVEGKPGLDFDARSGHYVFRFGKPTPRLARTCGQITLALDDGTFHSLQIQFGE